MDDRARSLLSGADSRSHFEFYWLIARNCFQVLERVAAPQPNISEIIASRDHQFHLIERPKGYAFAFCARVFPFQLLS
jgi:hypothetical protein